MHPYSTSSSPDAGLGCDYRLPGRKAAGPGYYYRYIVRSSRQVGLCGQVGTGLVGVVRTCDGLGYFIRRQHAVQAVRAQQYIIARVQLDMVQVRGNIPGIAQDERYLVSARVVPCLFRRDSSCVHELLDYGMVFCHLYGLPVVNYIAPGIAYMGNIQIPTDGKRSRQRGTHALQISIAGGLQYLAVSLIEGSG